MPATDVPLAAGDKDARSISDLALCGAPVLVVVYAGNRRQPYS